MNELHATALEVKILLAIAHKWSGRCLEQRLQEAGVPVSTLQYGVMRILRRQQHTIAEISRKMTISPATLVPAVDALERHGFVERGRDPSDRRRTPLLLTERGGDILARVPSVHDEDALVDTLAVMGQEKRAALLALLREFVGAMPGGDVVTAEVAASVAPPEA